jgi:hypothetical protein
MEYIAFLKDKRSDGDRLATPPLVFDEAPPKEDS